MADTPKIMDLTPPDIQTDGPVRIDGRWEAMPVGTYAALEERIRKLEREVETLVDELRGMER